MSPVIKTLLRILLLIFIFILLFIPLMFFPFTSIAATSWDTSEKVSYRL